MLRNVPARLAHGIILTADKDQNLVVNQTTIIQPIDNVSSVKVATVATMPKATDVRLLIPVSWTVMRSQNFSSRD